MISIGRRLSASKISPMVSTVPAGADPKGTPRKARPAPASENAISVGDRRLNAAAPVTRRPRLGARALRAGPQRAAAVEPGEAAASGADRMHVDSTGFDPQSV